MLFKMIGKMLFKLSIPLFLVAGVVTYGTYSRGGDPAAMWKGFGAGVMNQFAVLSSNVQEDASKVAGAVAGVAGDLGLDNVSGGSSGGPNRTKIFTWKDANGVTQYSNVAPVGHESQTLRINPNQNVMDAVKAPKVAVGDEQNDQKRITVVGQSDDGVSVRQRDRRRNEGNFNDPGVQEVANQLGGTLPGVAGQVLSNQSSGSTGGLDPAQLLNMLKQ